MVNLKHSILLLSSTHALRGADRNLQDEDCLPCHVVRPEVLTVKALSPSSGHHDFRCLTPPLGDSYDSARTSLALEGLPPDLVQANQNALEAGMWHICIQTGHYQILLDQNRVLLSESPIIVDHSARRLGELSHFEQRRGRKTLLAVRVSSSVSGISPTETVDEIAAALFGLGTNPYQLQPQQVVVNHVATVSHRQLIYEPAVEIIPGTIQNGVTEISIAAPFDSTVDVQTDILPLIVTATRDHIGSEAMYSVDSIIFCLPTGASFQGDADWTAFTYLWEPYSYYQQSRCTRLSVVMHELGHSTGFQHSGTAENDYNDKAGYMGFAVNEIGSPLKAYNGHKHYISGWFKNRSLDIDPASAVDTVLEQRLVAFVHASDERLEVGDKVVIRVGDWFLQYNRAKLYNFQTEEKDTVTVTQATSEEALSQRLATLIAGQAYFEVQDGSLNLAVAVCKNTVSESDDVIDYAVVRFHQGVSDGSDLCSRQNVTDLRNILKANSTVAEIVETENTSDNDQESGTGLYYPTDSVDDEHGDQKPDNNIDEENGDQKPDNNIDEENGEEKPDNYILERKKDSEDTSIWDNPFLTTCLALSCLFLLSVSAFITFKCLHRRDAASLNPRIRPVGHKHDHKNLQRSITLDVSETEDSDSSDASDIRIRESESIESL